jgi:MraZ protein
MDSTRARRTKLDKGRLRIPAAFRQLLHGAHHVFLTNYCQDQERCLLLFTPAEWAKFGARLNRISDFSKLSLFKTFFLGGAAKLPIDRRGRVVLPALLRKFLTSATVLVCRPNALWIR